jgi:chemotaxis protein histidine kinase CheA
MDELTSTFVNESRDQLTAMEDGLLRLEQQPDDADNLNAIFRAAHTIKGGSGVVECHFIEAFTHKVENVLDKLRNGEIPVSGELSTVMLECCDHLGALLDVLAAGLPQPDAERPGARRRAAGDADRTVPRRRRSRQRPPAATCRSSTAANSLRRAAAWSIPTPGTSRSASAPAC